jgi:Zn-finger nucleic acid-binding protein
MQCPRCQNQVLDEIDRSGVTVDRCTSCRGIWLDRGELEKLIARATAEFEGAPAGVSPSYPGPQAHYGRHHHEPPSSRRGHQSYHPGHKRRSFWHELFD